MSQQHEVIRATSSVAHDGARAGWQLRTIDAPDWAAQGHTNTTLWFGTNGNIDQTWVEVGATDGFHGQNVYRFYFAHRYHDANGYHYVDLLAAQLPVLGHYGTFIVTDNGTNVVAKVTDETTGVSSSFGWSTHSGTYDKWQIGTEYTCPFLGGSKVNKTYVYDNRYRRASDGLWVDASTMTLYPSGNASSGVAACASPVTFRYWVRSSTSTTGCN